MRVSRSVPVWLGEGVAGVEGVGRAPTCCCCRTGVACMTDEGASSTRLSAAPRAAPTSAMASGRGCGEETRKLVSVSRQT